MDIVNVLAALALVTLLAVLVLLVVRQVRILRACREDAQDGAPFDWCAWLWPMLLWVPLLLGGIVLLALLIARRMGSGGVVAAPPAMPVTAGPGLLQQIRDQGRRFGGAAVDMGGRAVAGAQRVGGRVVARVQSAGGRVVAGVAKQAGQLAPPTDAMSVALAGAALAFIVAAAVLGYMNTDGSMRPWLVLATVGAAVATVAMYVRCNPGDCPAAQEMQPSGASAQQIRVVSAKRAPPQGVASTGVGPADNDASFVDASSVDLDRIIPQERADVGTKPASFAYGESLGHVQRDADLATRAPPKMRWGDFLAPAAAAKTLAQQERTVPLATMPARHQLEVAMARHKLEQMAGLAGSPRRAQSLPLKSSLPGSAELVTAPSSATEEFSTPAGSFTESVVVNPAPPNSAAQAGSPLAMWEVIHGM